MLLALSTVLLAKKIQFQLNMLFPNGRYVYGVYIYKYDGRRVVLLPLLFSFFLKKDKAMKNELF